MGKKLWKTNEVKVDIASYMHYIRGVKKVGKTTLFNDLVDKISGGDMSQGLLISLGDEDGYKALNGLMVATAKNWAELNEIINELVNNKKDNDFKFIGLDTVDELFNIGVEEVLRLHKKKYNEKCETLNSAFGGYGAGRDKLKDIVRDQVARLKGAGYGIFAIGHTKLRNVKEKGKSEEYQQLTTSLNFDYDSVIADKADIVATISIDKDIVDVQNINVGGKTKQIGSIGGVTRWIHFRDDNFNVDCGARFGDIIPKVELSAENYIEAIEDAIKNSAKGKSKEDIEKMKAKEIAEREEKAEKLAEESSKINPEKNEELTELIKNKFTSASQVVKLKVKEIMDKHNIASFKDTSDTPTEALQEIAEALN
ncbi:AAA family ATPase [Priestia flexa]|uniref:AAA family ATPase n=1 Tax=Priestia flexa TaxID=86664 RepID=UPI00047321F5|nr:AAA family ATPase [Priestia flexa]